jgi:hypothetical protein
MMSRYEMTPATCWSGPTTTNSQQLNGERAVFDDLFRGDGGRRIGIAE